MSEKLPEVANAPAEISPATDAMPLGHGERVLFVDDEESLALLAVRVLGRLGYKTSTFTSPQEALRELRAHPHGHDVVVTDLAMPEMNGLELLRAVREIRPDMPILLTSGNLGPRELQEAAALGVRSTLPKPASLDEVARALAAALRDER